MNIVKTRLSGHENKRGRIVAARRLALFALAAACLVGVCTSAAQAQEEGSREYPIKAAFVYNFLKYIDFPAGAVGNTLTIAIVGTDPSDGAFDALNGKVVDGKTLVVRHLGDHYDFAGVNVVFVPNSEREHLREIIANAHPGLLTVGESPGFAQQGGVINFIPAANRVRFQINPDAAAKEELRVSSQLLRLADIVH